MSQKKFLGHCCTLLKGPQKALAPWKGSQRKSQGAARNSSRVTRDHISAAIMTSGAASASSSITSLLDRNKCALISRGPGTLDLGVKDSDLPFEYQYAEIECSMWGTRQGTASCIEFAFRPTSRASLVQLPAASGFCKDSLAPLASHALYGSEVAAKRR